MLPSICECGEPAVKQCEFCKVDLCKPHTLKNAYKQKCCADCRDIDWGVIQKKRELVQARKYARESATWPLEEHSDRVALLRGDDNRRKTRPVPVTGAELAACAYDAGVEIDQWRGKKSMLQPNYKLRGWLLWQAGQEYDSQTVTIDKKIISTDGAQWHLTRYSLKIIEPPEKVYAEGTLWRLYESSGALGLKVRRDMQRDTERENAEKTAWHDKLDRVRRGEE